MKCEKEIKQEEKNYIQKLEHIQTKLLSNDYESEAQYLALLNQRIKYVAKVNVIRWILGKNNILIEK